MSAFSQLTGLAKEAKRIRNWWLWPESARRHTSASPVSTEIRNVSTESDKLEDIAEAKRIRKIRNVSTESDKLEDIAESNAERKKTQFDNKSYDSERRGMERASETARVNAEAKKSNDEAELRARARQAPPIGAGGIWTRGKRKIGRDINDPTRVAEQRARKRRVMGNSFR